MSEHEWTDDQVGAFVAAHALAAVTTSPDRDSDGDATTDDLATEARVRLDREAREFVAANETDLVTWLAPDHAGYDLWMTRAGEGVGFWARYLPNDPVSVFSAHALRDRRDPGKVAEFEAAMKRLTEAAHRVGALDVYEGDDGLLYV